MRIRSSGSFATFSVADPDTDPFLRKLRERPSDAIEDVYPSGGSLLARAIDAHGGHLVGRFFEPPQLPPISRFTSSPLEALSELDPESGLLIALMLRRSRVFFVAAETSFDVIVLGEDQAQLIVWRARACPYRVADHGDPGACEEGLLEDVQRGNDTILRRAGLEAFPNPLRFIQSSNLAPPYEEAIGCMLPTFVGESGGTSRGLHLIEGGRVAWHDAATLGGGASMMEVGEVRPSRCVSGAWEWIGTAEGIPFPVIATFMEGLRVG